jgi:pyruvate-formate lyase
MPDIWSLMSALHADALADPAIADAPTPLRLGGAFAYALEHLPIGIPADGELAGDFGWDYCSESERARWTPPEPPADQRPPAPHTPSPNELLAERFNCFPSDGGGAHTTVDCERVVTQGLAGIVAQIEERLQTCPESDRAMLQGMEAALRGVTRWAERYAELAERLAAETREPADRERLLRIARNCRQVPGLPARTFAEAVQGLWLVHLAVGLSEWTGSSLSLGRLDQYLLPLFTEDLRRGVPRQELKDALAALFRALNNFFGDAACAVNLGGADAAGRTQFNPLSRMIVEVAARLRLPAPVLAARIDAEFPEDAFDLLTDPALFQIGQPTFYGEEACIAALLRRGVPAGEVHTWCANSCMGLMMPGREWSNMWGTVVNVLLPLELALNNGRPFRHELPIALASQPPDTYADFETLFTTVCSALDDLVDYLLAATAQATLRRGEEAPNPFVSALLGGCVERARDRLLGGCDYQTVIVEAFGLVNASDALVAIRDLVFERGTHTLRELTEAARGDFIESPEILHALRRAPKFGNADPVADGMARRLADRFAASVSRHSSGNLYYLPSFHTLNAHVGAGHRTAASLDGRRAGDPLAKNVGTSPGKATSGHTALMRSAATIDQSAFSGGQALDIRVDPALLSTPEGRRKFQALLRGYFDLGGLQVQVNALSAEALREARTDPQAHRDLLVRIAGYSAPYLSLPDEVQIEMIERFEVGV